MNPLLIDLPEQILTPRLVLRPPRAGDGRAMNEAIHETAQDLKLWMPWAQTLPTVTESEINARQAHAKWILRQDLRLHLHDRQTGRFLGGSGLHQIKWAVPAFEVGFWLRKSAQGQGYISESTTAIARFAFSFLGAKRLALHCDARNAKSRRVAERLGFELEGRLRHEGLSSDGELPRDVLVFSRLNDDGLPPLDVTW